MSCKINVKCSDHLVHSLGAAGAAVKNSHVNQMMKEDGKECKEGSRPIWSAGKEMVDAIIKISRIEYEKSFESLYPRLMKKLEMMEQPKFSVRFLLKLGSGSQEAFLGVLKNLTQDYKDEFLIYFFNTYRNDWMAKLRELLLKDLYGKNIRMDTMMLQKDENGQLDLYIQNISVDYKNLAQTERVKQFVSSKAGTIAKSYLGGSAGTDLVRKNAPRVLNILMQLCPPSVVENKMLSLMNCEEQKGKIIAATENVMKAYGVQMDLTDAEFVHVTGTAPSDKGESTGYSPGIEMPIELENALLDALVVYVKGMMS